MHNDVKYIIRSVLIFKVEIRQYNIPAMNILHVLLLLAILFVGFVYQ